MVNAATAAFKRTIRIACCDELSRRGFTRFRRDAADWPLERGFHFWIGLNTALYGAKVTLSLFFGLHVVPLERLICSLASGKSGRRYDRAIATYAVNSADLVPHDPFEFFPNRDIRAEVVRLVDLCVRHGHPFASQISSYDALLPLLRSRVEMLGGYPEALTCSLYLMGQVEEAKSFINSFIDSHPEHASLLAEFRVSFLNMINRLH